MSDDRDYWAEAYQIMAGSSALLPERRHLEALRDAHVRDLDALNETLSKAREDF